MEVKVSPLWPKAKNPITKRGRVRRMKTTTENPAARVFSTRKIDKPRTQKN
jgi:hypothetical protein